MKFFIYCLVVFVYGTKLHRGHINDSVKCYLWFMSVILSCLFLAALWSSAEKGLTP